MAFSSNHYQQLGFGDRMMSLTDRDLKMLEESWAGAFARDIFPAIDETLFMPLYSQESGSPSAPVNVTVSALILEEIFGLNDEEIVADAICDLRFQYALHTTSELVQPVSARTLRRFRKRCVDHRDETGEDLMHLCFGGFAEALDRFLGTYFEGKISSSDIEKGILREKAAGDFDIRIISRPDRVKENVLPAHSDHAFYPSEEDMMADRGSAGVHSSFLLSLNGMWKFSYAKNPAGAVRGFEKTSYDVSSWDEIRVPSHIQLEGYDRPAYVNYQYPWDGREEVREGRAPVKFNPTASYVKEFELPSAMKDRPVFISFQGVESGFALWLNGSYVGYSEDSFTPSEFELTPYLKEGRNRLAVRVFKWTSSSWLEDQDFFRFSGIFRDVYLYTIPEVHVRDLKIRTLVDKSLESAKLEIGLHLAEKEGMERHLYGFTRYRLEKDGRTVLSGEIDNEKDNVILESVGAPSLWSAEDPALYDLYITLHAKSGTAVEWIHEKIGFRRFELKNGLMLLNGKRIVFKGVNRHEFSCDTGRAGLGEKLIREDLALLKRNNINAVRTSHYPNSSLLYRLCDEYGIYLIAENNMETHGTWSYALLRGGKAAPSGGQVEMPCGGTVNAIPGNNEIWLPALRDRVISCYERDKNHPSILIWSVGNESFGGSVIFEMSRLFRNLDPDRLVHYEGIANDPAYPATSDMESRMYMPVKEIRTFLKEHPEKPFISCEYSHSMGNSNGGLFKYTDLTKEEPRYQGGFIWDFADQSIRAKDRYGREYQAYGGDFFERPSDYGFSGNGIVAGDRMPYPKLAEIKYDYQDIGIRVSGDGVHIENRSLFTDTGRYDAVFSLLRDGILLRKEHAKIEVAPLSDKTVSLPFDLPEEEGEYAITVSFVLKEDTLWAERGHEVAFGQGVFPVAAAETAPGSVSESASEGDLPSLEVIRGNYNIGAFGSASDIGSFDALISLLQGGLVSYRSGGREWLEKMPALSFFRAPVDNDRGWNMPAICGQWKTAGAYAAFLPPKELLQDPAYAQKAASYPKVRRNGTDLDITVKYYLPTTPLCECDVTYRICQDGSIRFILDCTPPEGLPPMPEFGIMFTLSADLELAMWYGNGPDECYCDRERGSRLGIWETTATDNMTRYLIPQECGNRTGVRWAKVTDRKGRGLLFSAGKGKGGPSGSLEKERKGSCDTMNFSVLPWTPAQIEEAAHHTELPPVHHTIVRITLGQMGVAGDDSWGACPHEEFLPDRKHLHFEFSMRGVSE